MQFVTAITVPKNTPATAPTITEIPLAIGHITMMAIQFPSGVNALAHIQLWRGLHQLFPTNQDGDFASGAETIIWPENEDIDQPPASIFAHSWNTDDTYDHTLTVRVTMDALAAPTPSVEEVAAALNVSGTPGQEGAAQYPLLQRGVAIPGTIAS